MKFDAEKLSQDIDAIAVCEDARKGIKRLFANHFGVNFIVREDPKAGEVWFIQSGLAPCVYCKDGQWLDLEDNMFQSYAIVRQSKKVADSPKEYFGKKRNGIL